MTRCGWSRGFNGETTVRIFHIERHGKKKASKGTIVKWRCRDKPLLNDESNARRFHEFPGVEKTFRCRFEIPRHFVVNLNQPQYDLALTRTPHERFESLLKLCGDAIKSLFGDPHPACILVCFPEEVATLRTTNPRPSYEERSLLEQLQKEDEAEQMSLFEPTEDQKRLASELLPQAEEILFRNFHRAKGQLHRGTECDPYPSFTETHIYSFGS